MRSTIWVDQEPQSAWAGNLPILQSFTNVDEHQFGVCTGQFGAGPGCFKTAAERLHISFPAPQFDVGPVTWDVTYLLVV